MSKLFLLKHQKRAKMLAKDTSFSCIFKTVSMVSKYMAKHHRLEFFMKKYVIRSSKVIYSGNLKLPNVQVQYLGS
jgi:hypothetical protein